MVNNMMKRPSTDGDRGVSEIYGTFLIISFVIVVAISVIGIGTLAFQNLGDEADDNVAEQSMLELDNKLSDIASEDIDSSETLQFPDGSGSNVDAQPEHGVVNITVATNDSAWQNTDTPGELVRADKQINSTNFTLGTVVYEGEDGLKTAYQGGAVWEKQGNNTKLVSPPSLDVRENKLELSLVDISDLEVISEGEELEFQQNSSMSSMQTERITQFVQNHFEDEDGVLVAKGNITMNITTEYAQGWADYAETLEGLSEDNVTVYENPDDYDKVEIELGEYGKNLFNLVGAPDTFDDDIIYTGMSKYAPQLYNDSEGTIENISSSKDGFNVTDVDDSATPAPGNYTMGMLFKYSDSYSKSGSEWWVWNGTGSNKWVNAEDPTAAPRDWDDMSAIAENPQLKPDGPDTATYGENEFGIDEADPWPWTCVVNTQNKSDPSDFREYLPNSTEYDPSGHDNGCLEDPVGEDDPGDFTPDYDAFYKITDYEFKVYNKTTDSPATGSQPFEIGENEIRLFVEGVNNGTGYGSGEPVAFPGAIGDSSDPDPRQLERGAGYNVALINATRNSTAPGETFSFNATYTPTQPGNYSVSASTADDDVKYANRKNWTFENPSSSGIFEVNDVEVKNDPVDAGVDNNEVEVTVEIENTASEEATQPVYLKHNRTGSPDRELRVKMVNLNAGETRDVTFEWSPKVGDDVVDEFNVTTYDDSEVADVTVNDPGTVEADFQIQKDQIDAGDVIVGEEIDIPVQVTNVGNVEVTQNVLLKPSVGSDTTLAGAPLTLGDGDTDQATLTWTPTETGVQNLNVTTDDDDAGVTIDVKPEPTDSTFEVEIIEATPTNLTARQDTLQVTAEIENTGSVSDTKQVWLENIDGTRVDLSEETLSASGGGTTTTVEFTWTPAEAGEGPISVNTTDDSDTAEVSVDAPEPQQAEFEVSIPNDPDAVTEGEPVNVTAEVENVGNVAGDAPVVLERYDPEDGEWDAVDVTRVTGLNSGASTDVALTWYTLIGDADGDEAADRDLRAVVGGDNAESNVTVEPRQNTRPPIDVVFVLDESGSMGIPDYDTPADIFELNESEQYTVGEDEVVVGLVESGGTYYLASDEREPNPGLATDVNQPWYEWYPRESFTYTSEIEDEVDAFAIYKDDSNPGNQDPLGLRMTATRLGIGQLNSTLGDNVGIVQYDNDAVTTQTMTGNLDQANESLRRYAAGSTDIADGIEKAEELVEQGPNEQKYIIVLTDGEQRVDCDPSDREECAELVEDAADDVSSDIRIDTVGFGGYDDNEEDEDALEYAANQGTTEGKLWNGTNPESLTNIFPKLVGNLTEDTQPPKYVVDDVSVAGQGSQQENAVGVGETITIETDITNKNETQTEQPVLLKTSLPVDGTPVNLSQDETAEDLQLQWSPTATELENIDFNGEQQKQVEMTVSTPQDEQTINVWVEQPPEEKLSVEIEGQNSAPNNQIIAGQETLEVTVNVTNTGGIETTQRISLERGDGSPTGVSQQVTLDTGESQEITLNWNPQDVSRDVETEEVNVVGQNDQDTTDVYIKSVEEEGAVFDATLDDSPTEVIVGDQVEVTATIENIDQQLTDDAVVTLLRTKEGADNNQTVAATRTSELEPGETEEVDLTWWTDGAADGDYELYVKVTENADNGSVTLKTPSSSNPFEVDFQDTNADVSEGESVLVGNEFKFNFTVTNTGSEEVGKAIELVDTSDDTTLWASWDELSAGEEKQYNKTWTSTASVGEVELRTVDDAETRNVDITAPSGPGGVGVDIVDVRNSTDPSSDISAGSLVEIEVDLDLSGIDTSKVNDITLAVEASPPRSSETLVIDYWSFNPSSSSVTKTFTWNTLPRYGDDNNDWEITAFTLTGSDSTSVNIEEVEGTGPGGAGFGGDGDDVDIDIGNIQIS
jgi:hypothetical protein